MLFEVIQDVIKNSNKELYKETQTAGLDPQENCIMIRFVSMIRKLIVQQTKV